MPKSRAGGGVWQQMADYYLRKRSHAAALLLITF
jgi:hypothetical protein